MVRVPQRRLALNLIWDNFYQTREKKTLRDEKMKINISVKTRKFKNFEGIIEYCIVTYRG